MMESNKPETSVEQLMGQIREEVANQKSQFGQSSTSKLHTQSSLVETTLDYIKVLLNNAEIKAKVRTSLPSKFSFLSFGSNKLTNLLLKIFNFLFKEQREINFNLIEALKGSLTINQKLMADLLNLKAELEVEKTKTTDLTHRFENLNHSFDDLNSHLNDLNNHLNHLSNYFGRLNNRFDDIDARFANVSERYLRSEMYLKSDLAQQKRLITLFLDELKQKAKDSDDDVTLKSDQQNLDIVFEEETHLLDTFFVALEDRFRGSYKEILDRLKVYLPFIEKAQIGTSDSPILDVGCGRGEWLELLRESGYVARGIDINNSMLEYCESRGLQVSKADLMKYLQSLPNDCLGAITGFHIIEHLSFETLLNLFTEALRVLKPSGLLILETPNPENVLVGSHTFYLDPTHKNPIPSLMLEFLANYSGFTQVQALKLNPSSEKIQSSESQLSDCLNYYFYGPQDHAVIGYKP